MTDRERFLAWMLGEKVDRPPFWLFWGPWGTTWARWQRENPALHEGVDYRAFFGTDCPPRTVPVNCGPCPKIEQKTLSETDEFVTFIDSWGIKRRNFKHHESMSEFIEFPVKTRRDWEEFKTARLNPDDPARLDGDWREKCAAWTAQGDPLKLGYFPDVGIFGGLRWLLGHGGLHGCLGRVAG